MFFHVEAVDATYTSHSVTLNPPPDHCPLCNYVQVPIEITAFYMNEYHVQLVYRCVNKGCSNLFVAYYSGIDPDEPMQLEESGEEHPLSKFMGALSLRDLAPKNILPPTYEEEIRELSPGFCEIHEQAHRAEQAGLKQVSGCGYRKALEFLIKDYCVRMYPGKGEDIKKLLLGTVISQYIDHPKIKSAAKKAAWLGNDETHYVRKWEELDIKHLKELMDLAKFWIIFNIKSDSYDDIMPEPKK